MPNEPILNEPSGLAGMEQSSPSVVERDIDTEIAEGEKLWFYRIKVILMIVLAAVAVSLVVSYTGHAILAGEWDRIEKFAIAVSSGIISSMSVSYFFRH